MMILKTILIYVLSILSFILVPSINSEGSKSKLLIILKLMQTKKVSEPTWHIFFFQFRNILFGLSAQVNMAFIFDINTWIINKTQDNQQIEHL
jgi:tryptophan-rich sensory protein